MMMDISYDNRVHSFIRQPFLMDRLFISFDSFRIIDTFIVTLQRTQLFSSSSLFILIKFHRKRNHRARDFSFIQSIERLV